MLCKKEVKQMRDQLTNEHTFGASSFRHITAHFKPIVATNMQLAPWVSGIVAIVTRTTHSRMNALTVDKTLFCSLEASALMWTSSVCNFEYFLKRFFRHGWGTKKVFFGGQKLFAGTEHYFDKGYLPLTETAHNFEEPTNLAVYV